MNKEYIMGEIKFIRIFILLIFLSNNFLSFGQKQINTKTKILEIKCDTIYPNQNITLKLLKYEFESEGFDGEKNSVFIIEQKIQNSKKVIFKENIFSSAQEIEFKDYNNDNFKDILVQNISDVRGNWTYNLYLFDPKTNKFKKVIGFEEIKSPKFNKKYNIIESYVVSGRNWTSFYKIVKNKIYDYNIAIEDDENENGVNKYDEEYKKAIKKILKTKI